MKKSVLIIGVMISFVLACAGMVAAENGESPLRRVEYGIEVQRYEWSEFNDHDFKLVEETGYLYGLTCDFDSQRNILGWRNGITLFGGEVDYDGYTWSLTPVKTDVTYIGAQAYIDIVPNYRFANGLLLQSFAGIGFRGWLRDLADTRTQDGVFVQGAEEWWWNVYGRAGVGASYPILKSLEIFTEAGTKIPAYAVNHVDILVHGSSSADLEPKPKFSPFCDLGFRWNRLTAKISYDTLWFDKSDSVASSGYVLHQPKSEAEMFNLSVAWNIQF